MARRRRYPEGIDRAKARAAIRAGEKAGEHFQAEFDRSGGRHRTMPKPPYTDRDLADLWQSGFDTRTEEARMEMLCSDCAEELELYEEQICEECSTRREECD